MGTAADACHHAEWKSWRRDRAWLKMPSPPTAVSPFHFPYCAHPSPPFGEFDCQLSLLCVLFITLHPSLSVLLTPCVCGLVKGLTFYLALSFSLFLPPSLNLPRQGYTFYQPLCFRQRDGIQTGGGAVANMKERWNRKRQSGWSWRRRGRD